MFSLVISVVALGTVTISHVTTGKVSIKPLFIGDIYNLKSYWIRSSDESQSLCEYWTTPALIGEAIWWHIRDEFKKPHQRKAPAASYSQEDTVTTQRASHF
jgi:hypothetical protein